MHPLFELDLDVPAPGSRRMLRDLHRQLRQAIAAGRLLPGLRLPSTRDFAQRFGVSRNTAIALYDLLLSEGFLETRAGAGSYVAAGATARATAAPPASPGPDPRIALRPFAAVRHHPPPPGIDTNMRTGVPDRSHFPFAAWRRLSNRVLRDMERGARIDLDPAGPAPFREAIARHVSFARAVACDAGDIVATSGAQQALDLIARILVRPGETVVAVEDPGYPSVAATFAAAGAIMRPTPVDGRGLMVDRLTRDVRIVCVSPSHQYPTGVAMAMDRRRDLLAFAAETGAVIVEDDYDSEFRFDGRPLDALQTLDRDGSVFYVGTFSKSLFLAFRLGFVVVPGWAREAILDARLVADRNGAIMPQLALAAFIDEGHLARHVRRMRRIYAIRRGLLLDALARHGAGRLEPIPSAAGLHLSAWLPAGVDGARVVGEAVARGVLVERIGSFQTLPLARDGLAFGFAACRDAQIEPAIRRIAEAVDAAA